MSVDLVAVVLLSVALVAVLGPRVRRRVAWRRWERPFLLEDDRAFRIAVNRIRALSAAAVECRADEAETTADPGAARTWRDLRRTMDAWEAGFVGDLPDGAVRVFAVELGFVAPDELPPRLAEWLRARRPAGARLEPW